MARQPQKAPTSSKEAGALDGFLSTIERVGNMVPHPAIIFFFLIGIVIVLSVILGLVGWSATYEVVDQTSGEVVTQTTAVRSLLSADGIRFLFTSIVPNFLGFGAVGVIIVAMIGVGVAEESGLIATLVRKIVAIAPKSIFTFIIVMLGVVSSIAADAGYLVLVPLGAAAFHSLGRHPLAGLAAAFSGVAAVFLVNVFVTPTDALLAEMTNDAIRMVDPSREVTLVGNLYFMIVSSILMGIVCTILTEKVVEPHLGPYEGGVPIEAQTPLTPSQSRGLRWAGRGLLGYVIVVGLLLLPPGAPLRHPETGEILSGSPFMSGLIVQISALFFTVGFCYGKGAGTVKDLTAAINMVVKTFAGMAGLIFLLLVISQFIAFFSFTNIATVLAANLADWLETVPLGGGQLHHHLHPGDPAPRPDHHRGGGQMGDLRAGVHPALHAARRGSEPGARGLPGRRLAGQCHHAAERLSRGDGRLCREVPEGCRDRHDRVADAALYRGADRGLDRASGRLVSAGPAARPGIIHRNQGETVMSDLDRVLDRIDADMDAALERLFATLRLKSISTDPAYAAETRACAAWHAADLAEIGFEAGVRDTAGHPIVVGHQRDGAGHVGAVLWPL